MFYFTKFPTVEYDPTGQNAPVLATDITRRFKISDIVKDRRLVYYEYDIRDDDRPDIMAEKYYGDSRLDWLFFIVNQIYDPFYQWPLNQQQMDAYLRSKYGSPSVAMATVHHYEQIVAPRKEYYSNYDNTVIMIPEQVVIVDQTTYVSLASTARREVSVFDHEEELNNNRRRIKILNAAFVPEFLRSVRTVFDA